MESSTNEIKALLKLDEKKIENSTTKPEKPKPTFQCLVCGKSYSKKTSLYTHHKTHPEFCVFCGENRGSSTTDVYEHNLKHVDIRPFVCKICGESFLRKQQFSEHEKVHDKPPEDPVIKESKYKCKTCHSAFSNWKLFYKHQQDSGHFNEKFLCEICGSEFHSNFLLGQHIRRLHKRKTDESFPCPTCSKIFASKLNLDSHIKKIHQSDSVKFTCETCNRSFSNSPNLKQHIKTLHEVEREYECQTCKKPFKAKNRLTRHEKEVHMVDAGEARMFNCDHCQKKYKRSWHQVRHSQMKHENSNASTTTTLSSAGTPEINESPTPEMNGNSNFTYQLQQVPQMPSQAPQDDNTMRYCQNQQQNANNFLGMNGTWDENNGTIQELHPANYRTDYCNNRFDQSGNTSASNYMESNAVHHDSWNSQQRGFWEFQQQQQPQAPPMYHQPTQQPFFNFDANHQHHDSYNNPISSKADYNCLNQASMPAPFYPSPVNHSSYSESQYFYPQPSTHDPYAAQNTQQEYIHSHENYHHSNNYQNM